MAQAQDSPIGDPSLGRTEKTLVLVGPARIPLTKSQQTFNRLVKKIESLHAKFREQTARLDASLVFFREQIHPRRMRLLKARKELVTALAAYLETDRLTKVQRAALGEIIAWQLDEITKAEGSLPQDLRPIFEKIHGVSFEQAAKEEMESARAGMEDLFEAFGMKIDLSGFKAGMTNEEMAAEAAKIAGRLKEEGPKLDQDPEPAARPGKKPTKKEQQLLLAEEARKRSISKIYRDLARVLHPDLEPDESIRPGKVALMQKLTVAYHNNDLHTLLQLELEWIEGENGDVQRMTDEKLAIYNKVLQEQVKDLESQLSELPMQPQYQSLVESDGPFDLRVLMDGREEAGQLDVLVKSVEATLSRLRGGDALVEIRHVVRDYRQSERRKSRH